jgi:hypothetical protein
MTNYGGFLRDMGLLLREAEAFGIPLTDVGLADFDADVELLQPRQ